MAIPDQIEGGWGQDDENEAASLEIGRSGSTVPPVGIFERARGRTRVISQTCLAVIKFSYSLYCRYLRCSHFRLKRARKRLKFGVLHRFRSDMPVAARRDSGAGFPLFSTCTKQRILGIRYAKYLCFCGVQANKTLLKGFS